MIVAGGAAAESCSGSMLGFKKTSPMDAGISCVPADGLVRMAAGRDHALFLYENGTLKGIGSNLKFQLGLEEREEFETPVDISIPGEQIIDMDCALMESAVLTESGRVFLLGKQKGGKTPKAPMHELELSFPAIAVRLGVNVIWVFDKYGRVAEFWASNFEHVKTFCFVAPIIDCVLTSDHGMLALLSDGSVWGAGKYLGGETIHRIDCMRDKHVVQIGCGYCEECYGILCDDGKLYMCGTNSQGYMGLNHCKKVRNFQVVAEDVVDFAFGMFHTMIIKKDGTVWGAGMNNLGQLLISRSTSDYEFHVFTRSQLVTAAVASVCCGTLSTFLLVNSDPLRVPHISRLDMEAASKRILMEGGYKVSSDAQPSIYSCGRNEFGQLGHEGTAMTNLSLDASAVRDICAGAEHTVVHLTTGIVLAFGCDQRFQIGIGGGGCYVSPMMVKIGEEDTFYTVTCGPYYTAYVPASNRNVVILCSSKSVGQPMYFVCESPVLQLYAGPEYPAAIDCNGDLWTFIDGQSRKIHVNAPLWDVFVGNGFIFAITSHGQLYGNSWLHNSETAPDEFCQLEDVPVNLYARVLGHGDQAVFIMRDGSAYRFTPPDDSDDLCLKPELFEHICDGVIDGACGRDHIVLVKQNGDVCTFGSSDHGQLDNRLSSLHCVGLVCCGVENTFVLVNCPPRVLSTSIFDPKGCLEDFAPLAREKHSMSESILQEKKQVVLKPLEDLNDLGSLALALQENQQAIAAAYQNGDITIEQYQQMSQDMNAAYMEKLRSLTANQQARNFAKEIEQATIVQRPVIMQEAMQYYSTQMQSGAITPAKFQEEVAKLTSSLAKPAPDMPK